MRVTNRQLYAGRLFLPFVAAATLFVASCKKNEVTDTVVPDTATDSVKTELTGRQFVLTPDTYGRLSINNSNNYYKPGDVLILKGNFSAVYFYNLSGSSSAPIIIRNPTGAVTTIGNTSWAGGSWAEAVTFTNCHYIKLGGEKSKKEFLIKGSTQSARQAYFDVILRAHTDNFEIRNITITGGGTGIWAKTDPAKDDASTWHPNSQMNNLSIHDCEISGTYNEAMYIGHTATYWDLTSGLGYNGPTSGFTSGHKYVQPIKWYNVKIYNNYVHDNGADGIQTAATDRLEIYNNEVKNWAMQHNPAHNGGILIGGRVTNSNTHDNYVHDGWGELMQFYGSGAFGQHHKIHNNLFRDNQGYHDGVSLRGTDNAQVDITNNTIANTGGVSLRINGYDRRSILPNIVNANAFIRPKTAGGAIYANAYIYTEGGGTYQEGTGTLANVKVATLAAALVDINNYYLPKAGSPLGTAGYRKK
ncbi:right-handed parallel beta-helix repeat-containing protein [Chitinophaga japonensis]|uniref:Parallel beta helix pectate lyase-like protein n=1 Tax=Chitinophaga japonensis TaxID=104662 RepID=A0A562TFN6_CHIJA|nr:right-handed parallel beta-helix repeat-containing protein [Chitinophaga japonensis]TWI92342.1 parallel beta helix pectate lyase-like protein [Chitinophaga japonensis]